MAEFFVSFLMALLAFRSEPQVAHTPNAIVHRLSSTTEPAKPLPKPAQEHIPEHALLVVNNTPGHNQETPPPSGRQDTKKNYSNAKNPLPSPESTPQIIVAPATAVPVPDETPGSSPIVCNHIGNICRPMLTPNPSITPIDLCDGGPRGCDPLPNPKTPIPIKTPTPSPDAAAAPTPTNDPCQTYQDQIQKVPPHLMRPMVMPC